MMNVAHIETQSFIYGPGCRFVIWVQGCSIHCKGCWNSEMWSFQKRDEYTVSQLFEMARNENVEGVTILGGEPLDQFEEVFALCEKCQSNDISTMIFTGYEINEIETSEKFAIKSVTDILVTGRYIESLRTIEQQWIGSTNQHIFFLTDRYANYKINNANYIEIDIDESGKCTILGFPNEKESFVY